MASWTISTLFLVALFSLLYNDLMGQTHEYSVSLSTNLFAHDLMYTIVNSTVCSPFSINNILALTYMGAKGKTADELKTTLKINTTRTEFGLQYNDLLNITFKKNQPKDNAPELKMANRLYVSSGFKVKDRFKKIAQTADFSTPLNVVEKINKWVEEQTEKKIKNIVTLDSVDYYTKFMLVNTIYFKAKWLKPFQSIYTYPLYVTPYQAVNVNMLLQYDIFGYVELPDLNACAVELPYQNSDISMLVILPNKRYGLQKLVESLKGKNLNEIISKMQPKYIRVGLPKFRIEYEIDLKEHLRKMGISSMFDENANLSGIYESDRPQKISEFKQKALLECNEEGTYASTVTYSKLDRLDILKDSDIQFHADQPFFFAIRSKSTVFFSGHVVTPLWY